MFSEYYTSDNANLAFRSLFEHSHDAVFFLDLDGRHIAANQRGVELLGYTLEELQQIFVSQTSASAAESKGVLDRLKAGEDVPLYERTFRRKDGTEVYGEVSVVLVKDLHGNPLHIQSVIRDITDRKKNEQALRAANDYLEALVTSIPDTIFVISEEGQFLDFWASDGLLYKEPKEFLGGSYKQLLPPSAVEKYEQAIAGVRGDLRIAELNYTLPLGNEIRHFNARVTRLGSTKYIAFVRDNTTQQASMNKFRTLFETLPVGVTIADSKGTVMESNEAAMQILGLRPEDHEGRSIDGVEWHIIRPDGSPMPAEEYASVRALKENQPVYGVEMGVVRGRDNVGWIIVNAAPIPDIGVVISYVDITELKEIQESLTKAKTEAERATQAKSMFLANMSHEIRTPLNAVLGFTELLERTKLTPTQRQYVYNARVSGRSLMDIINDILDFSKIEAGMLELNPVDTDLVQLAKESIEVVRYSAEGKGLTILLDLDSNLPGRVRVDGQRLKQVLVNLLSNGAKFTREGELELRVECRKTGDTRGVFSFSVRDTGIGISVEQQARLFKPFSQGDESTTREYGGTGLGLIISDVIVKKMGGKIQFESERGKGTTFSFSFEAEFSSSVEPLSPFEQDLGLKGRCLLVQPPGKTRENLQKILDSRNLPWFACDTGSEAIELLNSGEHFGAIFWDSNLPDSQGLQALRTLRDEHGIGVDTLPIILLHTASQAEGLEPEVRELGISLRMTQPPAIDDLFRNLRILGHRDLRTKVERLPYVQDPKVVIFGSPTILVAEDVPMNRMLVRSYLQQIVPEGKIVEVEDGEQAVQWIKENPVDLILMDVQMPVMDGREATRLIRAWQPKGQRLPIIALTAGALKEERESCLSAGMDDFVSKPLELDRLRGILLRYLIRPTEVSHP